MQHTNGLPCGDRPRRRLCIDKEQRGLHKIVRGQDTWLLLAMAGIKLKTRPPIMVPQEQQERDLAPVSDERVREYLLAGKVSEIPTGWVKPEVRESWQRCLEANLDPDSLPDVPSISAAELKDLRERHAELNEIARMEVHNLYAQ